MSLKSEFFNFTNGIRGSFKRGFARLNANSGDVAPSSGSSTVDDKVSIKDKISSDEVPKIDEFPFQKIPEDYKVLFVGVLNVGKSSLNTSASSAKKSPLSAGFPQFRGLPPEIQSMIGVQAALANSDGLMAGLRTLSLVSNPLSNHLAAIPLLNGIETSARDLVTTVHKRMYPLGGLPEQEFTGWSKGQPLYADEHVTNAVRNWKFLSEESRSGVVEDVLNISNPNVRLSCIRVFGQESGILEPKFGRPIVRDAIELFRTVGATSNEPSHLLLAANAVIHLKNHAGPDELLLLRDICLEIPKCKAAFETQTAMIGGLSHEKPARAQHTLNRSESK